MTNPCKDHGQIPAHRPGLLHCSDTLCEEAEFSDSPDLAGLLLENTSQDPKLASSDLNISKSESLPTARNL
jgi:hypothetical protein